jgi:phage shock protein C
MTAALAAECKRTKLMTAQAQTTNLLLRNDTILGVCEAIGQDFGFNPNWLRVAFCAPVFWNPAVVIGVYLALGLVVLGTRYAFPDRSAEVPAAVSTPAAVETRATEIVEERELIAA